MLHILGRVSRDYLVKYQGGIRFMTVCLSVCLLAGLDKYYWLDLHEKKMGLGPT